MSDTRQWTIGRAPDCDVILSPTDVSGRHCRLSLQGGVWTLEDLGSSNGTYVNGRRLNPCTPTVVRPTDSVLLGATPLPWPQGVTAPAIPKTVLAAAVPDLAPVPTRPVPPPPTSAPRPRTNNGLILVLVGFAVLALAAIGVLGWMLATSGSSKPKPDDDKKTKEEDKEPAGGTLIDEDFSEPAQKGDALPKYWVGKDVAVVTEMKRAFLEPTSARSVGVAAPPPLSELKGDFTIQGDAFVQPTLSFVLEGDGPRLSVSFDWHNRVRINDNAPRQINGDRGQILSYKIVRKGSTVRVLVHDELVATAAIDRITKINKLQILLGMFGEGQRSKLFSIKVKRD